MFHGRAPRRPTLPFRAKAGAHSAQLMSSPPQRISLCALEERGWLVEGRTEAFSCTIFRKGKFYMVLWATPLLPSLGNFNGPLRPLPKGTGQEHSSPPTETRTS